MVHLPSLEPWAVSAAPLPPATAAEDTDGANDEVAASGARAVSEQHIDGDDEQQMEVGVATASLAWDLTVDSLLALTRAPAAGPVVVLATARCDAAALPASVRAVFETAQVSAAVRMGDKPWARVGLSWAERCTQSTEHCRVHQAIEQWEASGLASDSLAS